MKISSTVKNIIHHQEAAKNTLHKLRAQKPAQKKLDWEGRTVGQRVSDWVAEIVGSWAFIIIQTVLIIFWISINIFSFLHPWDPYPFILLNLVLSFQAAFTAPVIMMSQNRQNAIDRQKAEIDYKINIKAELEIEQLHYKIDLLREQEIKQLIAIIEKLEKKTVKS